MNALQAAERLSLLENILPALSTAIDEARYRQDVTAKWALGKLRDELAVERDELNRKLTEVQI